MAPKAFMSHAWEDKDRFVVDRIFDEGIKRADIFIVVLSRLSVDKPWVREELNAGMVKKIARISA
jgi:hypothetical protein